MPNLSELFAPGGQQRGQRAFMGDPQEVARLKRQIVMGEAQQRGLEPGNEDFWRFAKRRLIEVGDLEGAFVFDEKRAEFEANQAAARAAEQQQTFENSLAERRVNVAESAERRAAAKPKNVELVKAIDPETGEPRFFLEQDAIGLTPVPQAPLVQVGREGDKLREKAAVGQEIARGQALPLVETYLDTLKELNDAAKSRDFDRAFELANRASAQENIAGRAIARLQEEGKLTDDDVRLALKSMPSVASIRNLLSGGGAFEDQEAAFRQILNIPARVGVKAPQEMSVEEIEAELRALRAKK